MLNATFLAVAGRIGLPNATFLATGLLAAAFLALATNFAF